MKRQHGTHQNRLVKKLRRKEIHSHEGANVYLQREYLPEHNQRFARAAGDRRTITVSHVNAIRVNAIRVNAIR